MFDPYGIYKRSQRKTHNGQIIRKKPIALKGSISTRDKKTIEDYAKALGYKLIPIGLNPFPEEQLTLQNEVYVNYQLPREWYLGTFSLWNLVPFIKDLPCLLIVPSLAYTLNSLQIGFFAEFVSISDPTPATYERLANILFPHFQQPVVVNFNNDYTRAIITNGTSTGYQWYLRQDQNSDYELHNEVYTAPVPAITGPIDYIPAHWEDNEALDVYNVIQTADPEGEPPEGFPQINYFTAYESSPVIEFVVRFHATVITTWTHTLNTEWIAE